MMNLSKFEGHVIEIYYMGRISIVNHDNKYDFILRGRDAFGVFVESVSEHLNHLNYIPFTSISRIKIKDKFVAEVIDEVIQEPEFLEVESIKEVKGNLFDY